MNGAVGPTGPAGPAGPPGSPGSGSGARVYGEDEIHFAGFTQPLYTGALGGRPGAHAICASTFPGSHFCHASEYHLAGPPDAVPASGAWIDQSITPSGFSTVSSSPRFGRFNVAGGCSTWTNASAGSTGLYVNTEGFITSGGACNVPHALACCDGTPGVQLAGFTTADAVIGGGRPSMHAQCNAQFVGSHLCHAAEYHRAASAIPVPANGAWMDQSVDETGSSTVSGAPSFGRFNVAGGCSTWTSTSAGSTALYVNTEGFITSGGACNLPRKIACCI